MNSINSARLSPAFFPSIWLHLCSLCTLRLWWGGVTAGAVWPGSLSALPSPLHLLHVTQHRLLPGPQLPRRARGDPRPERACFPAEQQDPAAASGPLLAHYHHAVALLQQHLLHTTIHLPRLWPSGGAWPRGQPAPEGHRFRHVHGPRSATRSASIPLWPDQPACRDLCRSP